MLTGPVPAAMVAGLRAARAPVVGLRLIIETVAFPLLAEYAKLPSGDTVTPFGEVLTPVEKLGVAGRINIELASTMLETVEERVREDPVTRPLALSY